MGTVNNKKSFRPPPSLGTFGGPGKIRKTWLEMGQTDKVFWVAIALCAVVLLTMNW